MLLAALYAQGKTCIIEPQTTRDHTERMLNGLGYELDMAANKICLSGGGKLKSAFIHLKSKNGFDAAAVLSFSTLFAIVPLFALVFSIFSLSPYFADLQQYLDGFLFEQLLPKNHQLLSQ